LFPEFVFRIRVHDLLVVVEFAEQFASDENLVGTKEGVQPLEAVVDCSRSTRCCVTLAEEANELLAVGFGDLIEVLLRARLGKQIQHPLPSLIGLG
jgi:hypothetical protein